MREVAFNAGLIEEKDSKRLCLCLEPEAASIYCRDIQTDFRNDTTDGKHLLKEVGTKYMIVDAGGGTIDVVVHEIHHKNALRDIHGASGGQWGGNKVNERFVCLLEKIFSNRFCDKFREENRANWHDLLGNFEKCKLALDTESMVMRIPVPYTFGDVCQKTTGHTVEEAFTKANIPGVTFRQGSIILKAEAIKDLFEPVFRQIINHIQKLLNETAGVQLIVLVGGFGDCGLLQQQIKQSFSHKLRVLCPNEAVLAVTKGAVFFGHNPKIVTSRIARRTYGSNSLVTYDRKKHRNAKYYTNERGENCLEVFYKWVSCGEVVPSDHVVEYYVEGFSQRQPELFVAFYGADSPDVEYLHEPHVDELGYIVVPVRDSTKPVTIQLCFGNTEITVQAKDEHGTLANAHIDLLSNKRRDKTRLR